MNFICIIKIYFENFKNESWCLEFFGPQKKGWNSRPVISDQTEKQTPSIIISNQHISIFFIQAKLDGRVIAREDVPALRKNVTAKCYGGDYTRKRKLLDKQKEGKKKMRSLGRVEVDKSVFMDIMKSWFFSYFNSVKFGIIFFF